jgi:hypothetical protein
MPETSLRDFVKRESVENPEGAEPTESVDAAVSA